MAKSGVTLSLLWNEYCETCRLSGEIPFMYTQFCKYYRDFASTVKATMHIDHKPGEQMEVDWAGQTASGVGTNSSETGNQDSGQPQFCDWRRVRKHQALIIDSYILGLF